MRASTFLLAAALTMMVSPDGSVRRHIPAKTKKVDEKKRAKRRTVKASRRRNRR